MQVSHAQLSTRLGSAPLILPARFRGKIEPSAMWLLTEFRETFGDA